MNIQHVKSIVIGAVADGECSDQTQALAKIVVTDDLLAAERRELLFQAREIIDSRRPRRTWSVNQPAVVCRDDETGEAANVGCYDLEGNRRDA
jgi:hypothetical protein